MGKFAGKKVGIIRNEDNEVLAVYPEIIQGTDEEIEKEVKDWFYKQECINEEILRTAHVGIVE